jgi:hypothetical protein
MVTSRGLQREQSHSSSGRLSGSRGGLLKTGHPKKKTRGRETRSIRRYHGHVGVGEQHAVSHDRQTVGHTRRGQRAVGGEEGVGHTSTGRGMPTGNVHSRLNRRRCHSFHKSPRTVSDDMTVVARHVRNGRAAQREH